MIFVTLGTQDKEFPRLLEAIDKAIEKGEIKEKVIVQAGNTKYQSENMEIFDLISPDEFNKYIDNCDILITHGGVGSIITAVKKGKKVKQFKKIMLLIYFKIFVFLFINSMYIFLLLLSEKHWLT